MECLSMRTKLLILSGGPPGAVNRLGGNNVRLSNGHLDATPSSDLIRTESRHGVWRVTRNDKFYGDYLAQQPAVDAALKLSRDIERSGGIALVLFGK